jgi:hypothetical protein
MSSNQNTERAVLAGGCFWGMQDLIRKMDGVVSTRVGYSGGDVANATYRNHGTHAEAIEIVFDPKRLSYRRLLEFFFQIHDPTTKNQYIALSLKSMNRFPSTGPVNAMMLTTSVSYQSVTRCIVCVPMSTHTIEPYAFVSQRTFSAPNS